MVDWYTTILTEKAFGCSTMASLRQALLRKIPTLLLPLWTSKGLGFCNGRRASMSQLVLPGANRSWEAL